MAADVLKGRGFRVLEKCERSAGNPDPKIKEGPVSKKTVFGPSGLILVQT